MVIGRHETTLSRRHLAEVVRRSRQGIREYAVDCTCGAEFEPHPSRRMADLDLREHYVQVTDVPAAELCRRPREHRTPPTERCPLCADQLDLLDDIQEEIVR
ncbi:hypothetical protein ACFY4C_41160 [Actinomadura viridis]|uniref:hypothetical protein n=1 Tax=Actinomadura viridis TaxID=58110 RepID=UPI0036929917